ncbi:MAG: family 10 glycosylhydrolase [Oscillospiraceae bacterium]|nr:family 10 glycosylhydrolase [Oscillospiraceae bacterium]
MNRIFRVFLCMFWIGTLVSCSSVRSQPAESPVLGRGQAVEQLHLSPVRHEIMTAAWLPYFTVFDLFSEGDEDAVRSKIHALLLRLKAEGINTVFVHVCPFGETVYPSAYYPQAPEMRGMDAMRMFSEECMRLGLSLHAWFNPLRLQTPERMAAQPPDSVLSGWFHNEIQRVQDLSLWDGRYYLNPASSATVNLLSDAVQELISVYHPAGVHIDDYFYPTESPDFDERDFLESGAHDLADWRQRNITAIVQSMYRAAHESDESTLFSISPQGDLQQNTDRLYADIPHWLASGDCCDAMIPQIYFGYENVHCPFRETVDTWLSLPRSPNVRLIIGLAAYKVGNADVYAGDGQDEWIMHPYLLAEQVAEMRADSRISGVALYHADAVLGLSELEQRALRDALTAEP